MTNGSVRFLRAIIILIGIGALAFLILEPLGEGRNANATLIQVYFGDPFLAYAYTASIAFFVALYQAFVLLGYVAHKTIFSMPAVKALRTIKRCGIFLVGAVALPLAYLLIARPDDDIAGGVALGLVSLLGSLIIATTAAVAERIVQTARENLASAH